MGTEDDDDNQLTDEEEQSNKYEDEVAQAVQDAYRLYPDPVTKSV